MPELLAPAGSWEALEAAVAAGADAVYLGGRGFNARASASNFDAEGLPRAVDFCHLRGVKVLVTVNTLIREEELEPALQLVEEFRQAGADGLIVQDLGLARAIAQTWPDAPLHASTQMTIHNVQGAQALCQMGFRRVVLARELSLSDIQAVVQATPLEVECFAHGALCVSVSGKCLMSSLIGGRSGNRGRCAQPCRLPYSLLRGQETVAEGYLLSPKDLCTLPQLAQLVQTGVSSLKLEGRLKRPEYVSVVTGVYRRALDAIAEHGDYHATPEDEAALLRIFNRGGFTSGYLHGVKDGDLLTPHHPAHAGVPVGRVTQVKGRRATLQLSVPLLAGDGIEFRSKGRPGVGMQVSGGPHVGRVQLSVPEGVHHQDEIFRTTDSAQLSQAQAATASGKTRPVQATVQLTPGAPAILALRLEDCSITVQGTDDVAPAERRPLTPDSVGRQLGKLGGTAFHLAQIDVLGEQAYLPVAALNDLRRRGVAALEAAVLAAARPAWSQAPNRPVDLPARKAPATPSPLHPALWVQAEAPQALAALKAGADGIYLTLPDWRNPFPLAAFDPWRKQGVPLYLALPPLVRPQEWPTVCARLEEGGYDGVLTSDLGMAWALAQGGVSVCLDYRGNAANAQSVATLLQAGISRVTLSVELTSAQAAVAARGQEAACEAVLHGRLALMTLAHCPIRAATQSTSSETACKACRGHGFSLRDRKGYLFALQPVRVARCLQTLHNTVPLCMADALDRLPVLGSYRLMLDRQMDAAQVTAAYRALLDGQPLPAGTLEALKADGHTHGHWFRGVQ